MPHHVVDKVADALNSQSKSVRGSKILILGIAYKRDIDDIRESPALDVMAVLKQRGGQLSYHDPYAPHLAARDWPGGVDMASVPLTTQTLAAADCVVIITDHKTFNSPGDPDARAADRGHAERAQGLVPARVQAGGTVDGQVRIRVRTRYDRYARYASMRQSVNLSIPETPCLVPDSVD